jgi:hypothetical protein
MQFIHVTENITFCNPHTEIFTFYLACGRLQLSLSAPFSPATKMHNFKAVFENLGNPLLYFYC